MYPLIGAAESIPCACDILYDISKVDSEISTNSFILRFDSNPNLIVPVIVAFLISPENVCWTVTSVIFTCLLSFDLIITDWIDSSLSSWTVKSIFSIVIDVLGFLGIRVNESLGSTWLSLTLLFCPDETIVISPWASLNDAVVLWPKLIWISTLGGIISNCSLELELIVNSELITLSSKLIAMFFLNGFSIVISLYSLPLSSSEGKFTTNLLPLSL